MPDSARRVRKKGVLPVKIVVIDGQGGRLGCLLVEAARARLPQAQIYAIGTNTAATAAQVWGQLRRHRGKPGGPQCDGR